MTNISQECAICERVLARKLKEMCDTEGKEIDVAESSKIIYQLGRVYRRRSPDKISLVRCAVLLNAARLRRPKNEQIKEDIQELCSHVLQLAGVSGSEFDLVAEADYVSLQVDAMRKQADSKLAEIEMLPEEELIKKEGRLKKICLVEALQELIYNRYIAVMKSIMEYCVIMKGRIPCAYALVGMGSLARKEITPYSDFEHVILLEEVQERSNYEDSLEYFRWVSVIFNVVLANLGETIIPSVNLPFLNDPFQKADYWFFDDYTKRGISFDGMLPHACKFPLGRAKTPKKPWSTELIKPVSQMLAYLEHDNDIKNGYHLADILTKTCFVAGTSELHEMFHVGVHRALDKNITDNQLTIQVKEDLINFYPISNLDIVARKKRFNLKRVVYRSTTLFIAALGRYHKVKTQSSFDTVRDLTSKSVFDENFGHELQFAVAVACYVRLFKYSAKGMQEDLVDCCATDDEFDLQLIQLMGASVATFYFQTALKLQRKACEVIGGIQSAFVQWSPVLDKLFACYWLQQRHEALTEAERIYFHENVDDEIKRTLCEIFVIIGHSYFESESYFNALRCYRLVYAAWTSPKNASLEDLSYCANRVAHCLFEMGRYEDAFREFEYEVAVRQQITSDDSREDNISMCYDKLAECCYELGQYEKSLAFFEKAKILWKKSSHTVPALFTLAHRSSKMGQCFCALEKYSEALSQYQMELEFLNEIAEEKAILENLALCYTNIGGCYYDLNKHDDAIHMLEEGIRILKTFCDKSYLPVIAQNALRVGDSFFAKGLYDDALKNYEQALKMRKMLTEDEGTDNEIGVCFAFIASCHLSLGHHDTGLVFIEKTKSIWEKTGNLACAVSLADFYMSLGGCLLAIGNHEAAYKEYENELLIRDKVVRDNDADMSIVQCQSNMADCCFEMEKYEQALKHYEQELLARKEGLKTDRTEECMALCYSNMGNCNFNLDRFDKAIRLYQKSKAIWSSSQSYCTFHVAECNQDIGDCFFEMRSYKDALKHYSEELNLRKVKFRFYHVEDIQVCLNNITECCMKLKHYHKAESLLEMEVEYWKNKKEWLLTAHSFLKLADLCLILGKVDHAYKHYQEELTFRKQLAVDKEDDVSFARCYANLAKCLFQQNKYEEAAKYWSKSKCVWICNDFQLYCSEIAKCIMSIGDCLYELSKYAEAKEQYQLELEVRKQLSEDESKDADVASCLDNIAHCHFDLENYSDSFDMFEKAKTIWEGAADLSRTPDIAMCNIMRDKCLHEMQKLRLNG